MSRARKSDLLNALFAHAAKTAQERKRAGQWSQKAQVLRGVLMPNQARLEADRSPRVAVRSARQVGKSTGAILLTTIRCLEHAESDWVVIGLTRPSVKRIYWKALQGLDKMFELGIKFQFQELVATFPNGSRIFFVGAENIGEIEKLRGGRYHGAVVDECKSYPLGIFEALLQDVLEPALMGQAGQLYLIGTPGDILSGDFYWATCRPAVMRGDRLSNALYGSDERGLWSLHVWTLRDNVIKFKDPRTGNEFTLWDKALETKAERGWGDDHPTWRREYLGEWVATDNRLVYRYQPHLHDYVPLSDTKWGLPERVGSSPLRTVVGFDFGTRDGTAIVVWAYSETVPDLWELYSEKRTAQPGQKLTVGDIAAWYKEVEAEYGPFDGWPADWAGLATMVMDTLADEHGVYLEQAEKKEKLDHIELFNNDLEAGRIHIRRGSQLAKELQGNRWLAKHLLHVEGREVLNTEKRQEDPATPNDLCDAALYAFRWCRHRQAKDQPRGPAMGTREWWAQVAMSELQKAEEAAKAAKAPKELDVAWWHE